MGATEDQTAMPDPSSATTQSQEQQADATSKVPTRPKTAFRRGAPRPPSAIKNQSLGVSPDPSRPTSAFTAPQILPRSILGIVSQKLNGAQRAQSAPVNGRPAPPLSAATAHRRYTPVHPTSNLLLAKIWDDAAQKRHLHKLKHMKPQIDNQAPKHFEHLTHRSKKAQLQQEYLEKVQRENHLLSQRMARRDRLTISFSNLNPLFLASRLGERKRAEEKKRIEEENLMLMQRVEDQKAYYQKTQWKKERLQNLAYLSNISRFPEVYSSSVSPYTGTSPRPPLGARPSSSPRRPTNYDHSKVTEKFKPETVQKLLGDGKIRVGMTRSVLLRVEYLEKKKAREDAGFVKRLETQATAA